MMKLQPVFSEQIDLLDTINILFGLVDESSISPDNMSYNNDDYDSFYNSAKILEERYVKLLRDNIHIHNCFFQVHQWTWSQIVNIKDIKDDKIVEYIDLQSGHMSMTTYNTLTDPLESFLIIPYSEFEDDEIRGYIEYHMKKYSMLNFQFPPTISIREVEKSNIIDFEFKKYDMLKKQMTQFLDEHHE